MSLFTQRLYSPAPISFIINEFQLVFNRYLQLSDGQGISGHTSDQGSCQPYHMKFCLVFTYRPILDLTEYDFKMGNICARQGAGGLEVWYSTFPRFSAIYAICINPKSIGLLLPVQHWGDVFHPPSIKLDPDILES